MDQRAVRKKAMKRILWISAALVLAGIMLIMVIISIITQMEEAAAAGEQYLFTKQEEDDMDASLLEHFSISGTKKGSTYDLIFQFKDWKIDGIRFEMNGKKTTISQTVKVPSVSGSRQEMAYQYLRQHGFTAEGACGLMANINAESTFIENREEGDASYRGETCLGRGWGICQWTNTGGDTHGRRYKAIQYVKKRGYDPTKKSERMYLAELQYAITEKGYTGIVSRMKKCTDVTKATQIWCVEWECPDNKYAKAAVRARDAKKYLKKYGESSVRSADSLRDAKLSLTFERNGSTIYFNGTLDGTDIAGTFDESNGKCSGSGEYGPGASAFTDGGDIGNPFGKSKFYITSIALVERWGRMHEGWDLDGGDQGTPIYAVSSGKVAYAGGMGDYGSHVVVIQSGNLYVLYGHMCRMNVHGGQKVTRGQHIGNMGNEGHSFGAHLHLEFRKNSLNGTSTANVKGVRPMFQRWASNYASVKSQFSRCVR